MKEMITFNPLMQLRMCPNAGRVVPNQSICTFWFKNPLVGRPHVLVHYTDIFFFLAITTLCDSYDQFVQQQVCRNKLLFEPSFRPLQIYRPSIRRNFSRSTASLSKTIQQKHSRLRSPRPTMSAFSRRRLRRRKLRTSTVLLRPTSSSTKSPYPPIPRKPTPTLKQLLPRRASIYSLLRK